MPFLEEYRDALREGLDDFHDINVVKKLGLVIMIVLSVHQGKVDERNASVFPQIQSPEVMWNGPELDPVLLEQELQEILDES